MLLLVYVINFSAYTNENEHSQEWEVTNIFLKAKILKEEKNRQIFMLGTVCLKWFFFRKILKFKKCHCAFCNQRDTLLKFGHKK